MLNIRNIFVGIVTILCLVSFMGAQEKKEDTRIEVKLLWERTFKQYIDDFSFSDAGNLILVNTSEYEGEENEKVKVYRYLIDKENNCIRQDSNEGLRNGEGKFEWQSYNMVGLFGVLSPDGKKIITLDGVENKNSNRLSDVKMFHFGLGDVEHPIYSPNKKYVAVEPSYDSDYPFLKVFNPYEGLLWEYKDTTYYYKQIPFSLVACFVSDESLMVFFNGKVKLYSSKNGKKYWETDLFEKERLTLSDLGYQILPTEDGAILNTYFLNSNRIYYIEKSGIMRWSFAIQGRIVMLNVGSKYFAVYTGKKLKLLDCQSGDEIWQRSFSGSSIKFVPRKDYLFVSGLIDIDPNNLSEKRDRSAYLYIINKKGKVLWKSIKMPWSRGADIKVKFSINGNIMIISRGKSLYHYSIGYNQ